MPQFGGNDSKRHFTVVMGGKEHGLYVSSTPSSAAKKAVTKLCAANKSKKVEFHIREITQDSKKKTYGPYSGHIEKLKEPIELKGRIINYKPVAKLSNKTGAKKGGMPSIEWMEGKWIDELEGYKQIEKNYMKAYVDITKRQDFANGYLYLLSNPTYEEISIDRKIELQNVCTKKELNSLEYNYWSTPVTQRPGYKEI